jgi:hypothetical protein
VKQDTTLALAILAGAYLAGAVANIIIDHIRGGR